MRRILLMVLCLGFRYIGFGQLTAADSAFFKNIFTQPRYVYDSFYLGSFYHNSPITSVSNLYSTLNNSFLFGLDDLDSISTMQVADNVQLDSIVNNSMFQYPWMYPSTNTMIALDYSFKNKSSKCYSYFYPDSTSGSCKNAFLIVPGTGTNESYQIVNNWGYHVQLCSMVQNLHKYGDVFTFIKPNEESRAIFWNQLKLNEYIVTYLESQSKRYGINYLIELIAWVRYMKKKYDKVFILGLSEGGYASLLCTMFEEPTAAVISGGYSIGFDTCISGKAILSTRFDALVDSFNRVKVKDKVQSNKTQYLFTWGENDPVITMDPEHDFHHTQNYFNGLSNCSYFYDFNDHTFPPCYNLDTFVERIIKYPPVAHFTIIDTVFPYKLRCHVQFCLPGNYSFDLYRDTQFVQSYSQVISSQQVILTTNGTYTIQNVMDSSSYPGYCMDSVLGYDIPFLISSENNQNTISVKLSNPFHDEFNIVILDSFSRVRHMLFSDATGKVLYKWKPDKQISTVNTASWSPGVFYLSIIYDTGSKCIKLIKSSD
ncbi:MAG: T9SS type A sorting domain-containing protein [Chitinophagaceae bacterium]|nr:T9SS type A sorting domain-containing protein [Chitinophagaceae bacterium]